MRRPIITGHEFSGEIVEVGAAVGDWKVGDRIATTHRPPCGACPACLSDQETRCLGSPITYGLTVDGGYAEEVLAWTGSLVRVPDGLPLEEAAFLHCTAGVALRALRLHAKLTPGQTVVITGASGGVGVHAVQVARLLGARVVAVTSNRDKVAALRAIGAEEVVVSPPDGGFHKEVMGLTGGGADVALELVGVPTFNAALRSLKFGGRLVLVGNVTAERVEVNPGYLILREIAICGSASASRAELAEVLEWARTGRLRPIVAARMKLEEARAAQARLVDKSVVGRILLVP
jgi:acryloyl-coenzyme A reductase